MANEHGAGVTPLRLSQNKPKWSSVLPSYGCKQVVCDRCGSWGECSEAATGEAIRAIMDEHTRRVHPGYDPSWLVIYNSKDLTE